VSSLALGFWGLRHALTRPPACARMPWMKTYPICLIGLHERSAVVVGGGRVAARKVYGLLAAGARVTVISPDVLPELQTLGQAGRVQIIQRPYQEGDLAGAFLAVVATDDTSVNQAAWQEAMRYGCLVNVVDDPTRSDFIVPAVLRRGELTIAVSTGGASPALARHLRQQLEAWIGPEYGELAELLAELRPTLIAAFETEDERQAAADQLVSSDILGVLKRQGYAAARQYAQQLLARAGGEA
jgi:precorrin-2 dehydrogenase/sirohydrochlorin ferrochelatase